MEVLEGSRMTLEIITWIDGVEAPTREPCIPILAGIFDIKRVKRLLSSMQSNKSTAKLYTIVNKYGGIGLYLEHNEKKKEVKE